MILRSEPRCNFSRFVYSAGHGEDHRARLAVGQCLRNCIHFVSPSQRIILEELLDRSKKCSILQSHTQPAMFQFESICTYASDSLGRGG
ncbi:hypothetical protein HRI_001601300 [Hibiscus trionum]|uniref:Uncharacterized protein n=1 Tax=Hibiscus trionum TaxID=183268 RepID=A0A9W7HKA3_HIBTR|nr:hypothetical protein HRI_001601300 [Hibiscus trionum]